MSDDWHTVPFRELTVSSDPDLRWVGARLMDEEQYRVEGWMTDGDYWRPTVSGMRTYFSLRESRRVERKAAWRARQEADEEWSRHVEADLERRFGPA